jgi:sec-independent protein translocase protein TatC
MALGLFRRSRGVARDPGLPEDGQPPDDSFDAEEEETPGAKMSFLDHLDELRRRIIASLIGVLVGCLISFTFIKTIYAFIMQPLAAMLPPGSKLVYTEPTEAFMLYLKMALLVGIIMAAPVILWQVWLFISPGLYAREKKVAVPFIVLGTIGFVLGAAFSHYVLFPVTWRFLASFTNEYTMFMPKIESIFSLYAKMMLGMGVIFQMPTLVYFLARLGLVSARFLLRHFKYAVLIIFIIAAVITPTGDPMTQTVFAAPMILLYLISIGIAWLFGKKRQPEPAL